MTEDQFRTMLNDVFHGSVDYMKAWARKLLRCANSPRFMVNRDELKIARAVPVYLDSKGPA